MEGFLCFVLFSSLGYNFFLNFYLFVCLLVCVHPHGTAQVPKGQRTAVQEYVLSFHQVGAREYIKQVVRFGSKLPCPLSHLAGPSLQVLKNELCIINR